uniref:EGF domain-specific O-linked N-acetylglucosamine transferase n=1 Tax=Spongospora subterranea TaxID=70186 RepID=A0A0H5RBP8_9EUKA|eukprot:CRZ11650.1 hypothetical protein [Spongospora subterranea]
MARCRLRKCVVAIICSVVVLQFGLLYLSTSRIGSILVARHSAVNQPDALRDNIVAKFPVIEYESLLRIGKYPDSSCEYKTGIPALQEWLSSESQFVRRGEAPLLSCRVTTLPDQPEATRPHTLCNGSEIYLDPSKLAPAFCPEYRPGYLCDPIASYNHYGRGAFSFNAPCRHLPQFTMDKFPQDHLKDIFSSVVCRDTITSNQNKSMALLDGTTLLITRERGEHFNLFHAATDWLNAFMSIVLLDVPFENVSVLLLDDHAPSNLDIVWDVVFSRRRPTQRARRLPESVLIEHGVFVPAGYSSILYKSNEHGLSCDPGKDGVGLMRAFARHVVTSFNITARRHDHIRILLVLRKPYSSGQFEHKFIGRQIDNEDDVISMIRSLPGTELTVVDFAKVPLRDQIDQVHSSDVMIGMHGAGLLHAFWLPLHGALVEIRPTPNMGWRCFRNIAIQVGLIYDEYTNDEFPSNYREDARGDYTIIDVKKLENKLKTVIAKIYRKNTTQ